MEEQKHSSLKRRGFKIEFKSTSYEHDMPDLNASFPPNSHLKEFLTIQITMEVPTVPNVYSFSFKLLCEVGLSIITM